MHWLYHIIRHLLVSWGYWAVLIGVMGESAGLPIPGETTLLFASFLAHKNTGLKLDWLILIGIAAATGGDNLGFLVGRRFGPRLLPWTKKIFHLSNDDEAAAKDLLRRRGSATIFFARYIFGLRTIAGPLAGMLGMEWKRFLFFNFLGAATWVTAVSLLGYLFANQFDTLLSYAETVGWAAAAGLFVFGYLMWRHKKKKFLERQRHPAERAA